MAVADALERSREAYARRAWEEAYSWLSAADEQDDLEAGDLDRLGMAAYLTGRVDAAVDGWGRAHRALADAGEVALAARCAFWLGITLVLNGEHARGGGWLSRAHHMLEGRSLDCVEHGYLRVAAALQTLGGGDHDAAYVMFGEALDIAERFRDPDLVALSRLGSGQALVARGDATPGISMLDEAMVTVTTDDVSPIAAGIVYCAVILACREVFDLRRAQEWTAALSRWCATQPDLKPYRGQCLVHRAEIMQLRGEWTDAMEEVRHACEHLSDPPGDPVMGMALYQQAELLRLRGELARAEGAYREASGLGHSAQPGLALLRLAQGRIGDAAAAIRRVVDEADGPVQRSKVLAAHVEITLRAGDVEGAQAATEELGRIAAIFDSPYLRAIVEHARGSVLLARGDAKGAAATLRRASMAWWQLDAPYEAAYARLRMADACRQLGDGDTAEMELDAARRVFEQLGAAPALAEALALAGGADRSAGGLTPREAEVLRLAATGATNREIADVLVISEKTVARHMSNMFSKLGVSSRAAATAYAYEHDLV